MKIPFSFYPMPQWVLESQDLRASDKVVLTWLIRRWLMGHGHPDPESIRSISRAVGLRRPTARAALLRLVESGCVEGSSGGFQVMDAVVRMTSEDREGGTIPSRGGWTKASRGGGLNSTARVDALVPPHVQYREKETGRRRRAAHHLFVSPSATGGDAPPGPPGPAPTGFPNFGELITENLSLDRWGFLSGEGPLSHSEWLREIRLANSHDNFSEEHRFIVRQNWMLKLLITYYDLCRETSRRVFKLKTEDQVRAAAHVLDILFWEAGEGSPWENLQSFLWWAAEHKPDKMWSWPMLSYLVDEWRAVV